MRKAAQRAIDHPAGSPGGVAAERARAELAGYIAQMAGELVQMASAARLDLLAHFLAMARVEAELAARNAPPDDA